MAVREARTRLSPRALPSIWLWDSETDSLELVRKFGWEEFRNRLS